MATALEGSVEVKRISEFLTKHLGTSELADYNLLIDKLGEPTSFKVSLAALLTFAGSEFYDDLFKLISRANYNEFQFILDNLTANRTGTMPDISGIMAIAGMLEAFKFGGQATGGSKTVSFSATSSFNMNDGNSQQMTLSGNVTTLSLTNKVAGGSYLIYLIQDVTGGRTIPSPDSSFGIALPNSDAFLIGTTDVNMINVNVRADGTTTYTNTAYTP